MQTRQANEAPNDLVIWWLIRVSASQLTDKPSGCLLGYVPSWGLSTRWMTLHTYNELFDSLVIVQHVVSVSYFDRILAVMEVFYVHRFLVLYQVMHIRSGDAISSSPKVLWISTPHDVDARGLGGLVGTGGMLYTTLLLSEALWRTVTRHNTYVRREGSRYRRI